MGAAWRGPSQVSIFPYIALHLFLLNPSFCNLPEVDMQTQCAYPAARRLQALVYEDIERSARSSSLVESVACYQVSSS